MSGFTRRKLFSGLFGRRHPCTPGGSSSLQPIVKSSSLSQVSCLNERHKSDPPVILNSQNKQSAVVQEQQCILMCMCQGKSSENIRLTELFLILKYKIITVLCKDGDVTGLLLPVWTTAGLSSFERGGVIAPPRPMFLHGGSAAAPRPPAAPQTIHRLCGCSKADNVSSVNISKTWLESVFHLNCVCFKVLRLASSFWSIIQSSRSWS